jgi:hypothetical protein
MSAEHDQRSIRCKRLGHTVAFRYCRTQEGDSVCPSVLDCWWEVFDVRAALAEHLTAEELERLSQPRTADKVGTLLDLIREARDRSAGK